MLQIYCQIEVYSGACNGLVHNSMFNPSVSISMCAMLSFDCSKVRQEYFALCVQSYYFFASEGFQPLNQLRLYLPVSITGDLAYILLHSHEWTLFTRPHLREFQWKQLFFAEHLSCKSFSTSKKLRNLLLETPSIVPTENVHGSTT